MFFVWFIAGFLVGIVPFLYANYLRERTLYQIGKTSGTEFIMGEPFVITPEKEYYNRLRRPIRCGLVPPTPGYAGCTRDKGHNGPCAHALLKAERP